MAGDACAPTPTTTTTAPLPGADDDDWEAVDDDAILVTVDGHLEGEEPGAPLEASDPAGVAKQKAQKDKRMPTIHTARAVARRKRADLRRQLLVRAHCEHTFFLSVALYQVKALAIQCGATSRESVAILSSTPLPTLPAHPHKPPDPLPQHTADTAALLAQCPPSTAPGLPQAGTDTATAVSPNATACQQWQPLVDAGHCVRPVVGLCLDTSWAASLRKVGRFFEAAADAAVLGRPAPHTLQGGGGGGGKQSAGGSGYRGHRLRRKPVGDAGAAKRKRQGGGGSSAKKRGKAAGKRGKAGRAESDSDEDLFSFEGRSSGSEGVDEAHASLVAVSVDAILDAEARLAEHPEEADSVKAALVPWDPNFLRHTPRNPVDAVVAACEEETAQRMGTPTEHRVRLCVWAEVLSPEGLWQAVDPPEGVEHFPYVFAACAGAVLDVTPKYCQNYDATLATRLEVIDIPKEAEDEMVWERQQIADGDDGESLAHPERRWLARTIAMMSQPDWDAREAVRHEEELVRRLRYKTRPPASHSDLLKHRVFCAKTLLNKLEVVHPDAQVFTRAHQYDVYTREDVSKLRGREAWRRLGRVVKKGEKCIRKVAAAAGFGGVLDASTGQRQKEVFAHWQTQQYLAPIERSGSRISDGGNFNRKGDREGTVCLAETPLPPNLVHIRGARVGPVCTSLKVAYGKALVSFTRMGGFSRPNFDGVVVAKEDAPRVAAELEKVEAKRKAAAEKKRSEAIADKWGTLTRHLLMRLRLREQYMS